jgi:nitroreductase
MPSIIDYILARRSISPRRLGVPGPDQAQIEALIKAGCAAPDHRCLRPWRFILIGDGSRTKLADLFELAAIETHGDLTVEGRTRAREKAFNGACLIAIVGRIRNDIPDVPVLEQWVSVGAALQNILLGSEAMGFGAMIVSGDKVATQSLRDGFALSAQEQLLGFVAIGTPTKDPRPVERPKVSDVLTIW